MEWPQPVEIKEVVYYGRTAWEWEENWRQYEVYLDGQKQPVLKGSFEMGHGPQRVRLKTPVRVIKLTLKFLNSHGGSNPGASENPAGEGTAVSTCPTPCLAGLEYCEPAGGGNDRQP